MPPVHELIPIEDLTSVGDCPNTFVAVDVNNPEADEDSRLVGTVVGWSTMSRVPTLLLQEPGADTILDIPLYAIVRGFWAPMGYRPEAH